MKKQSIFLTILMVASFSVLFGQKKTGTGPAPKNPSSAIGQKQTPTDPTQIQVAPPSGESKEGSGALRQVEYFNQLMLPSGPRSAEENNELWQGIEAMSATAENRGPQPADWENMTNYGPAGGGITHFTGRIVDIENGPSGSIRILSAAGGLYDYWGTAISDKLNNNWAGAFATHPADVNTIYLGTGEPQIRAGTGMWKTTNGGKSWSKVNVPNSPTTFYKIAFHPTNHQVIWACSNVGLFFSKNGGATWLRKRTGDVTDFTFQSGNPNNMWCSVWGSGFYKSTNGSTTCTWTLMTTGGVPTTDVGRTEIACAASNNNIIYACVTKNSDGSTKGIYKSVDAGANWFLCNWGGGNFHGSQGWYDVALGVDPANANHVITGGVSMVRTTDGFNFSGLNVLHADQHCVEFHPSEVWVGNDGGFMRSFDGGATWDIGANWMPVSQFYHMSVGKSDATRLGGGTQDDGLIYTHGVPHNWVSIAGDGSGFAVDPFNADQIYAQNGIYGGILQSRNQRTLDGGVNWTDINAGITAGNEWFPVIRTDRVFQTYQWTERNGKVYRSIDQGNNWVNFSPGGVPFPVDVVDLTVGHGDPPNVYACLWGNNQLQVLDRITGTWINRSAGLPTTGASGTYVRKVQPSINGAELDVAYAVMGGLPSGAAKKVYKTTDRGATWVNLTGNLPAVSCTDIIVHPTDPNIMVLGTEVGAFRTDDGGNTWYAWWEGMPRSITITEMDYYDDPSNDNFYVYASTFGRGILRREMGAQSPNKPVAERTEIKNEAMPAFRLDQNLTYLENNGLTAIPYYLDKEAHIRISLFNESGQLIKILADKTLDAGMYQEDLRTDDLPSGVYFYTMDAPNFKDSKKMVVVR